MIKVSELLSKRLIALSSAETVGTAYDIIFDKKLTRGKMLKILDESESDCEIRYVELKKVGNLDSDVCVISDKSFALPEWTQADTCANNPINSECFNQDGKSLGKVRDVILDGTAVMSIVSDSGELRPADLLSRSDKLLVFNDSGKPIKLYKPRFSVPKPKNIKSESTVQIHSLEQPEISTPNPLDSQSATEISLPAKVPQTNTVVTRTPAKEDRPSPYAFLVGKTLSKDIAGDGGIILLRRHAVITDEVISAARQHGKLVQLALYAE